MGASTWAFGNHRCSPYRGIFTIKAIIHASHKRVVFQEVGRSVVQYWVSKKFRVPVRFWI